METFPDAAPPDGIQVHLDHPNLHVDASLVRTLAEAVLRGEQREAASLNVVLTRKDIVQTLNKDWLDHDYETDVLSFALNEGERVEGEIYVSLDFAREHCDAFGATLLQETCRYVVHGLLHLLGYQDGTTDERAEMRRLENIYLAECGIDPG